MGKQSCTYPWLIAVLCALLACGAGAQTQAGVVPLMMPAGLAYDAAGNLYFAEAGRHLVRRVAVDGTLTTVAGNGVQGLAGDGGPAGAAELDTPVAVAVSADGTLFVADAHNHRVRRVDAVTGIISTYALGGMPVALALDAAGNVYVADAVVHKVLRISAAGATAVVAGNGLQGLGGDGEKATAAQLDTPWGIGVSAAGDVLIADAHNGRVRRVDHATGIITTIAMEVGVPRGMAVAADGSVLVSDVAGQRVLRVYGNGVVTAVAGNGVQGFSGDGGPAVAAEIDSPRAVGLTPGGLVTVADSANGRVRQVDGAGVIRTVAGLGAGSSTASLVLKGPEW